MRIWIDNIELPKVDITCKDTSGRDFLQGEMVVHYTAYKAGNHTWRGEFKCSYQEEINLKKLSERILNNLRNDPVIVKGDDIHCVVNPNLPPQERREWQ